MGFGHLSVAFAVKPLTPLLGLGLWSSGLGFAMSMILELVLLIGGSSIYWAARKRKEAQ
jgi:hypothetical protein